MNKEASGGRISHASGDLIALPCCMPWVALIGTSPYSLRFPPAEPQTMITPDELRSAYISFFEERGHRYVPSSPCIPEGDPTLLFTNAGMNQFKDVLLGREKRDYTRAANAQKCIRAGGKHNDLDEVGHSARHLTFFEMLGNWSFGDYYKKESIRWAWDFVTGTMKIPAERIFVSVFREDNDAWDIWRNEIGIAEDHITRLDEADNFWSMGPTGPCGPCTEIYYDHYPERGEPNWAPGFDDERFMEIWNLVFMEFDRAEDGTLTELPMKSVDTGMGLDRVATITEGVKNVFHTGIFRNILARIESELKGESFPQNRVVELYSLEHFSSYAVIADHIRTLTFSICDGGKFSNEGRGYVLRRILRRAVRHGRNLGFSGPFLCRIVPAVVESFSHVYPELRLKGTEAAKIIEQEEARFFRTIDRGIALFDSVAEEAAKRDDRTIPGDVIFRLYDTFGFPTDLTQIMADEKGLKLDMDGYEQAMEAQRQRSRAADDRYANAGEWTTLIEGAADRFVGYDKLSHETKVLRYRPIAETEDEFEVCLVETPFYAESGGQVGDRGVLRFAEGELEFEVLDTTKTTAGLTHRVRHVAGSIAEGVSSAVTAQVDPRLRALTASNHTATHLLHAALHKHVSKTAFQAGSHVSPDRLRFDFSYDQPLTQDQLDAIENTVNEQIRQAVDLSILLDVPLADAEKMGAMMIFGEKYGEKVRVVDIPGLSTELCGGTHVRNTADIGWCRITAESGVAAGVRRIEAITNEAAFRLANEERAILRRLSERLRTSASGLEERIEKMQADRKELERELADARRKEAGNQARELAAQAQEIKGFKVVAAQVDVADRDSLLALADHVRDHLGAQGVALLVALLDGKPALLVTATDAASKAGAHAGKLVNAAAAVVGGKGGGRPTLAQAGGSDTGKISEAIQAFLEAL